MRFETLAMGDPLAVSAGVGGLRGTMRSPDLESALGFAPLAQRSRAPRARWSSCRPSSPSPRGARWTPRRRQRDAGVDWTATSVVKGHFTEGRTKARPDRPRARHRNPRNARRRGRSSRSPSVKTFQNHVMVFVQRSNRLGASTVALASEFEAQRSSHAAARATELSRTRLVRVELVERISGGRDLLRHMPLVVLPVILPTPSAARARRLARSERDHRRTCAGCGRRFLRVQPLRLPNLRSRRLHLLRARS
jgi:hypothetical protein